MYPNQYYHYQFKNIAYSNTPLVINKYYGPHYLYFENKFKIFQDVRVIICNNFGGKFSFNYYKKCPLKYMNIQRKEKNQQYIYSIFCENDSMNIHDCKLKYLTNESSCYFVYCNSTKLMKIG